MNYKLFLTFSNSNGESSHEFQWNVHSTPIAERWIQEMIHALQCEESLREQRFNGWATTAADQQIRVDRLNQSIQVINDYYQDRYHIADRPALGMSQDVLNALHHHFELLMGQSWKPSEYIKNVPNPVLVAIRLLNDMVHDYESADRVSRAADLGDRLECSFHCQLVPYRQLPLVDEDLARFSYAHKLGDIFSNYCQLGKTWIEVYSDQDKIIHPENISPLRYYSSTFGCFFYETPIEESQELRKQVQNFIAERSRTMGVTMDPEDPCHALGHIVYASLAEDSPLLSMLEEDRQIFMREHSNISALRITSDFFRISRKFPDPNSYYGKIQSRENMKAEFEAV